MRELHRGGRAAEVSESRLWVQNSGLNLLYWA